MCSNRTKLWTTRDGESIRVCDMGDSHLRNTVQFVRRNAERAEKGGMPLGNYFAGDIGDGYYPDVDFSAPFDVTWEDYVPDIYWDMVDELRERDAATTA